MMGGTMMGGQIMFSFLPCRPNFQESLKAVIVGINLAMQYNDESIHIQSSELPGELPVMPSAEQAVKVPLQPLQGSGDSAKVMKTQFSRFWPFSDIRVLPDFLHSESVLAPTGPD
jgi:hypothetical protein